MRARWFSWIKRFGIAFVEANVVRHIVVRTNVPVDAIIDREEVVAAAKAINMTLPTQISPVQRIILADILNFLTKLSSNTQGRT